VCARGGVEKHRCLLCAAAAAAPGAAMGAGPAQATPQVVDQRRLPRPPATRQPAGESCL